jgi:nucleotide-binding universal stress UspA family protein
MSEQESWRAGREAGRDVTAHPERPSRQEEILRYLGGAFYAEQQEHRRGPATSAGAERAEASGLVVVGVDDSPGSAAALDQAAVEASLRGWALRVVHVLPWAADVAFAASRDRGAALVAAMADRATALTTTPVSGELLVGSTADALIEQSASASLLVLGSRGMGPVKGLVSGSVSTRVVAGATSPVMVVPSSIAAPEESSALSIVVGVDGGAESAAAVEFAATEARVRGAALTAIRASTEAPSDVLTTGALDPARTTDIAVHRQFVRTDAAEALIDASARASAVVVGTRGRGGVRGVRLGSTSQALMRRSKCPVVIVPRRRPAEPLSTKD